MNKVYSRINWKNYPSEDTSLDEANLNRMDLGLDNLDNRVVEMDSTKVNVEVANTLIKNWTMDEVTGVITVEKLNGEKILFDLNIEKIPVDFKLSEDGILTMTTDDGSKFTANIGAMIPVLTFEDSDTIVVSVSGEGVNKTYSFSIKAGSVTEDKLQPNFLADVKTEVAKAQASKESAAESASAASGSATLAESYTHGGTGAREGEDTDNARYYMEQAKAVSAVDIATTEKAGIVKPDGTTITVDEDGTLHGQSKVDEMTGATADKDGTSGTVPAPTAGQEAHILGGDGIWKSPLDNAIIAAKIQELTKAIEDATALRASLEAYGMVKLCDSEAVTDSTGLALPATEKNASIEGTLAAQIASLNTDLKYNYTDVTEYKNTYVNIGSAFVYSKAGNKVTVQCYGTVNTDISVNYILCGNFPQPVFGYAALTIVNLSRGTSGTLLIDSSCNLLAVEEILKAGDSFSICGNYIYANG